MIKKAKNTAILNDEKVVQKGERIDYPVNASTGIVSADGETYPTKHNLIQKSQVLEIPNSDYINTGLNLEAIRKYNLKSITIIKGRKTVVEIIKEA